MYAKISKGLGKRFRKLVLDEDRVNLKHAFPDHRAESLTNPMKSERISFTEDDYLIVIAEDNE